MPGGVGIQVPEPLTSPVDMKRLTLPETPEMASKLVREKLPHVLQAVHDIRMELNGKVRWSTPQTACRRVGVSTPHMRVCFARIRPEADLPFLPQFRSELPRQQ